MRTITAALILLLAVGSARSDELRTGLTVPPDDQLVNIAPDLSADLLDWTNDPNGTSAKLLRGRLNDTLKPGRAYFHTRLQYGHAEEGTNEAGKFPYLGRFPFQHNGNDRGSEDIVFRGQLAATVTLPGITLFGEAFYSDTLYREDDRWDVRRASVTLGDLSVAPVYLKAGLDFVDFGHMGAYGPFLQSMNWHYFATQVEKPHFSVGYLDNGIEAAATYIPGGRHVRVAASDEGDPNFALDASYRRELRPGLEVEVGAGYLHDTIYDTAIPHHLAELRDIQDTVRNGAVNVRGEVTYGDFDLMAEYTTTLADWPATGVPVTALTVQGRWRGSLMDRPLTLSAAYGLGRQGEDGAEWEQMEQYVLGAELQLNPYARLQAEYVYNTGFAPLIAITRASDASVKAHTVTVGGAVGF